MVMKSVMPVDSTVKKQFLKAIQEQNAEKDSLVF